MDIQLFRYRIKIHKSYHRADIRYPLFLWGVPSISLRSGCTRYKVACSHPSRKKINKLGILEY
jgi:hypothetical protein